MFVDVVYEATLFMFYDTKVMTTLYDTGSSGSDQIHQSHIVIADRATADMEGTLTTPIHALFEKSGKKLILQSSDLRYNHRFILTSTGRIQDIIDEFK